MGRRFRPNSAVRLSIAGCRRRKITKCHDRREPTRSGRCSLAGSLCYECFRSIDRKHSLRHRTLLWLAVSVIKRALASENDRHSRDYAAPDLIFMSTGFMEFRLHLFTGEQLAQQLGAGWHRLDSELFQVSPFCRRFVSQVTLAPPTNYGTMPISRHLCSAGRIILSQTECLPQRSNEIRRVFS
jgi:hypothetical protein